MNEYLRKATVEDCELLLRWANDPVTRASSFSTAQIDYETHKAWFHSLLADPSRKQFFLMNGSEPVGQIRVCVDGEEAELSYSIAPEMRGMGYGSKMLLLIQNEVAQSYPQVRKLVARIKPENVGSQKVVAAAGFTEQLRVYEALMPEKR